MRTADRALRRSGSVPDERIIHRAVVGRPGTVARLNCRLADAPCRSRGLTRAVRAQSLD